MARLTWDGQGEKKYENGVSRGVLYKKTVTGVAPNQTTVWKGYEWNGLTAVTESPEGAEKTDLYADNIKYASFRSAETFGGTIEAYTYPEEFADCNGEATLIKGAQIGEQGRASFGLCYRTEQGNDEDGSTYGYKLHLVYNCTCSPSERAYETINDSPDAITFSWEFDSIPVNVTGHKATSIIVVDSTKFTTTAEKAALKALEDALYGVDAVEADAQNGISAVTAADPYLPDPDTVKSLLTPSNG